SRPPQVGVPGEDLPGPHVPAPPSTARWTGARAVVRRAGRGRGYGSAWTCGPTASDRKSTRLNSSHVKISYAVFCLKKKNVQGRPCRATLNTICLDVCLLRHRILRPSNMIYFTISVKGLRLEYNCVCVLVRATVEIF